MRRTRSRTPMNSAISRARGDNALGRRSDTVLPVRLLGRFIRMPAPGVAGAHRRSMRACVPSVSTGLLTAHPPRRAAPSHANTPRRMRLPGPALLKAMAKGVRGPSACPASPRVCRVRYRTQVASICMLKMSPMARLLRMELAGGLCQFTPRLGGRRGVLYATTRTEGTDRGCSARSARAATGAVEVRGAAPGRRAMVPAIPFGWPRNPRKRPKE